MPCKVIPRPRFDSITRYTLTIVVAPCQIELGKIMSLFGGVSVPVHCFRVVLINAVTIVVANYENELGFETEVVINMFLFGDFVEPVRRFRKILINEFTLLAGYPRKYWVSTSACSAASRYQFKASE